MTPHPPGTTLRDDDNRLVKVIRYSRDGQGLKVLLARTDRRPREHATLTRWAAEVSHYPLIKKARQ